MNNYKISDFVTNKMAINVDNLYNLGFCDNGITREDYAEYLRRIIVDGDAHSYDALEFVKESDGSFTAYLCAEHVGNSNDAVKVRDAEVKLYSQWFK